MSSNYKAQDQRKSQKPLNKINPNGKSKLGEDKLDSGETPIRSSTPKKPKLTAKEVLFEGADTCTSSVKNTVVRNPITGEGYPEGKLKISSRKRDGNPVLGTGYDVKTQKVNKMPVGGKSTILIT